MKTSIYTIILSNGDRETVSVTSTYQETPATLRDHASNVTYWQIGYSRFPYEQVKGIIHESTSDSAS